MIDRILERWTFPRVDDVEDFQWFVNLVRVVTGVIVTIRMARIVEASRFYFDGGDSVTGIVSAWETERALLVLCLAVMLMVGFLTPVAIVGLLSTYEATDRALATSELGSDIFMCVLVFFLVANAGLRLSVDSWLSARYPRAAGRLLVGMYGVIGRPTARRLTVAAALLFYAYAIISLGAAGYHLRDDYWRSGDTIRVLFSTPYLSRFDAQMRAVDKAAPWLMVAVSVAIGVAQTAFQLFMLPLLFWTWGRRYVIAFGTAFIAISIGLLQLSYLPYTEAVLWALVFARPRRPQRWRGSGAGTLLARVERGQSLTMPIAVCVVLALGTAATLVRAPQIHDRLKGAGVPAEVVEASWIATFQYYAGLRSPNVFNSVDLTLGDHWWVGYRVGADGTRTLIPFNAPDGSRMKYHRNDVLFFGNGLLWRRSMIFADDLVAANAPGSGGRELMLRALRYDRRVTDDPTVIRYEVQIWQNDASRLDVDRRSRYGPTLVTTFWVEPSELDLEIPRVDY